MSITTPAYYLRAHSGAGSPINEVTGTGALSGGTISLVDRGGGDGYVWRFSGSASSASFTAFTTNNDGSWQSPDLPVVFAVRAVIQTNPTESYTRFFAAGSNADSDYDFSLRKNADNAIQGYRSPGGNDLLSIGNQFGTGALRTVVVRLVPVSGGDHADIWVQTSGRSGSTRDYTTAGATYTEDQVSFNRVIITPDSGTFDIARIAIYAPEALSDADCAALADDFDATIGGGVQDLAGAAAAGAAASAQLAIAKAMAAAATGSASSTAAIALQKNMLAAAAAQAQASGNLALAKLLGAAAQGQGLAAGALDVVVGSGATITTPALKNNTGTVLAGESGITAHVYSTAGVWVATKTGETTDGAGVLAFSDAALSAGTNYRVVIVLGSGAEGMVTLAAA